jgi:hypothetical protein
MLLQLQDYGTSLWQLDYYATTLAGLLGSSVMAARAQGATTGLFLRRGRRFLARLRPGGWSTAFP